MPARLLESAQHQPVPLRVVTLLSVALPCSSANLGTEGGPQLDSDPAPSSHPMVISSSGGWANRQGSKLLAQALGSQPGTMCCCCCHWCRRCQRLSCALKLLLLLPLVLGTPFAVASEGPHRCDTIYQGFAECLIRLGDGMGHGGELETVCRSWNDFHACASQVLSGCPEEAAAVWESLQQEARRAPHPNNLHALCGGPVSVRDPGAGPETNQETLRATAPEPTPAPVPPLLAAALVIAYLLGPLA